MNALARHDHDQSAVSSASAERRKVLGREGEGRRNIGNESQPNANLSALFTTPKSSGGSSRKKMCRYGQMKEL